MFAYSCRVLLAEFLLTDPPSFVVFLSFKADRRVLRRGLSSHWRGEKRRRLRTVILSRGMLWADNSTQAVRFDEELSGLKEVLSQLRTSKCLELYIRSQTKVSFIIDSILFLFYFKNTWREELTRSIDGSSLKARLHLYGIHFCCALFLRSSS